jgi:raffinose/stachyose/melibiose transport system substrate-binding protein
MSTARVRRIAMASLMVAAVVVAAVGVSGSSASSTKGAKLDPATIKVWYLGDAESPGFEKWMKSSIAAFQAANPGVKVQAEVKGVDTWTATQTTACQSKSGPDIWYPWAGGYAMEQAWNGCTVAMNDFWSKKQIAELTNQEEWVWQGKIWGAPQFLQNFPIVYNKDLFKKAGLDPNKPPLTWTTLVADAKKIKAAGITPFVTGLKDGFGGENLAVAMQSQDYSVGDLLKMVTSGTFTDPLWTSWLQKIAELKPYFNVDTNSIPYAEGLARFQSGKAAMVFASPGFQQTIIAMSKAGKGVGIMKVPTFGKYGGILYEDTPGFQVLKFAKNKALAGNFLAFMHTQAEMKSLYADTGDLPNDKRWNTAQVTRPTDKLLVKWIKQKLLYYSANYYPTQLDVNGNFVALQGILGGNYTPAKAAELYQNVISKWRKINSGEINNYKIWEKSNP